MVITDSGSGPYDVITDVMKFSNSEISNDDISGTGRPINFVFDSTIGFSGQRIEWMYFRLYQIQEAAARHLGKFRMTISLQWVIRSTFMN